ncbi:MAG TPA: hypothetical protein VFO85_01485 [Vicinamibacteria bacterium]|nr:hypothetical protein [Vicinamibacteria bacterium]
MSDTKDEAYDVYRDAIRERVCSVCLDQKDDGGCGLDRRTCALEEHLPGVVEAVLAVESENMADYEGAIRALVCSHCGLEDERGRCRVRERGQCALDTYLYLVVEAVEQVRARDAAAR